MTDSDTTARYAAPTFRSRIWMALGFRWRWDEPLQNWWDAEELEYGLDQDKLTTETHIQLDFLDRLRCLITGHIAVNVYTKTDGKVKRATSRSAVCVLP